MSDVLLRLPTPTLDRRLRPPILIALIILAATPLLSSFQTNVHIYLRFTFLATYVKLTAIQLAVGIAVVSLIVVQPVKLRRMLGASGVGLPMLAVFTWTLLTAAWSCERWAATQPLVELAFLAVGTVAFANVFGDPTVRRRFVLAYGVTSAAACAAFSVCQLLPFVHHLQAYPFLNPNNAAAFAIIPFATGIALVASALLKRIRPTFGIAGGAVAVPAAAALVLSQSAAGMAAAFGAVVLVALFTIRGRLRSVLAEVLSVVLVLVVLWPFLAPESWPARWLEQQAGIRPLMWDTALTIGREQPFVGHGVGTFFVESARGFTPAFAAHEFAPSILETAHSLPLHLLAEVGLVGLALAAWLLVQSLVVAQQASTGAGHADRALVRGLACGGLGMLAQAAVSTEIHYVEVAVQLMLAMAVIGGIRLQHRWAPSLPGRWPVWGRATLAAVVGVVVLALAGSGLVSEIFLHYGVVRQNEARSTPSVSQRLALLGESNNALRTSIGTTWPCFPTTYARICMVQNDMAMAGTLTEAGRDGRQWLAAAETEAEALDRMAPNFKNVRMIRARLLRLQGRHAEALDCLSSYAAKDPFTPEVYTEWEELLRQAKREGHPEAARPYDAISLLDVVRDHPENKWINPETARRHQQTIKSILNAPTDKSAPTSH